MRESKNAAGTSWTLLWYRGGGSGAITALVIHKPLNHHSACTYLLSLLPRVILCWGGVHSEPPVVHSVQSSFHQRRTRAYWVPWGAWDCLASASIGLQDLVLPSLVKLSSLQVKPEVLVYVINMLRSWLMVHWMNSTVLITSDTDVRLT